MLRLGARCRGRRPVPQKAGPGILIAVPAAPAAHGLFIPRICRHFLHFLARQPAVGKTDGCLEGGKSRGSESLSNSARRLGGAGAGASLMTRRLLAGQSPTEIVGQSPASARLRAHISRVAPFASNVLISGPSGTGKELVARQIHALSPRAAQPFVPVDCASMTGELMSSQLFGHVAGAFTGANCDALGCFRAAHRGTIFLDEIGELDYSLQSKLLRVLQDHVVTPVGSHLSQSVDVRVVAATNRDLRAEVAAGRFREDLYYRLDVVHLRTTPLRDRADDVPLLATAFLRQLAEEGLPKCRLSPEAMSVLVNFDWPGNVRQLRNVLEQAAIDNQAPQISAQLVRRILSISFAPSDELSFADGNLAELEVDSNVGLCEPPAPEEFSARGATKRRSRWLTLEEVEREHIFQTLEHTFYNRSAAARLLGLTRQSLLRKMKRFGLDARRDDAE
jgi:DNA-binding NtrC family response regulator